MAIEYRGALFVFMAVAALFIRLAAAAEKDKPLAKQVRPGAQYTADKMRDPFEPYLKKEEINPTQQVNEQQAPKLPDLKVQGIMWGSNTPLAIVNNKVVKKDDVISGARVVNIDKDGVTVFFANRQYVVTAPAGSAQATTAKDGQQAAKQPSSDVKPTGTIPAAATPTSQAAKGQEAGK